MPNGITKRLFYVLLKIGQTCFIANTRSQTDRQTDRGTNGRGFHITRSILYHKSHSSVIPGMFWKWR